MKIEHTHSNATCTAARKEKKRKETKEGKSWMRIQSEMRKRDREIFTGVLIKAIGRKLPHYKTTRPT